MTDTIVTNATVAKAVADAMAAEAEAKAEANKTPHHLCQGCGGGGRADGAICGDCRGSGGEADGPRGAKAKAAAARAASN